jgi:hypothetical protein
VEDLAREHDLMNAPGSVMPALARRRGLAGVFIEAADDYFFGSRNMLHFGQRPFLSEVTSGCIGQT